MERQLKAVDVTLPQFGALAALSRNDRITQRELSEIVNWDATTVMVVCDSLEKKGLVQRLPDPSDRRVNRLVLTDNGKGIVAKAYPRIRDGCRGMLTDTSVNDLGTAVRVLEVLHRNAASLPDVLVKEEGLGRSIVTDGGKAVEDRRME